MGTQTRIFLTCLGLGLVLAFLAGVGVLGTVEAEGDAALAIIAAILLAWAVGLALVARSATVLERLAGARDRAPNPLVDPLTGLRNQRAFHEDLAREIQRHNRTGRPLTIVIADLNGLRELNDTLGHAAGDARLKTVAAALLRTLRGADAAYRLGGDEFGLLLAGEKAWGGFRFAQRLDAAFAGIPTGSRPSVTCGVAEITEPMAASTLTKRAFVALLEAKQSHRAAIVYSDGLDPPSPERDLEAERHHSQTLAAALARAVDAKDSYTRSHSETVSETCALIGSELHLGPERIDRLRLAGLLHDVGKIGVTDAILQKPEPLSDEEYEVMKSHAPLGRFIVSAAELCDEASWIFHHHERVDGDGYPDGLRGDTIPLESRIILVADAFEAMTSHRPYRPARSEDAALSELQRCAGSQFDPACVRALQSALAREQAIELAAV